MATTYTTREGDTVDYVAWKFYGSTDNLKTEAILNANHGLADYGPTLPANLTITLPDMPTTAMIQTQGIRLWN